MAAEFFAPTSLAQSGGRFALNMIRPQCGACGLKKTCKSPLMKPSGRGRKRILIVGEAPGGEEDERGEPFVGKSGKRVRNTLKACGIDPQRDCWFTNALICRPEGNVIKNGNMIDYCRPNLIKTIEELKPEVIILLGGAAVKSLIAHLWKDEVGAVSRWVGWQIPSQQYNAWVCPTFHPSYIMREETKSPVPGMMFMEHFAAAVDKKGRPWEKVPDYKKEVTVEQDSEAAGRLIKKWFSNADQVAWDYETNMLKPDDDRSYFACCSLSDGKKTLAFPMRGAALRALKLILEDDTVGKIASNIKFELRWTLAKLGIRIGLKGARHCTMTAAHVLDNRPMITSIKFQSFVLLGQADYDGHIKPYLGSSGGGGYDENSIKKVDKHSLMLYCGLDSLLEYKVAVKQMKELNRHD